MPSSIRRAATATALTAAVLVPLAPSVASAHGAVFNPVSRVAACYAEGPETPKSQVCKDLVADSGTQPLYDWNEVNIANADGRHRLLIPDGRLCSANREKYRALDWARTDWPATAVAAGSFDFKVRATAAHAGTMTVYITKQGFDPTQPLKWSDLDATPVATYPTTRTATDGHYTFTGTLPARTGRHIVYKVWQRSDSPEAFYSCSDVTFGGTTAASAPTESEIAAGAERSTVSHAGHGGDERPPALASAPAASPDSPLPLALAGAGALTAFAAGGLLLSRRRNASPAQARTKAQA
ncbi:lytic polysaccharide monooxygenase [Streptomyces sp. ISL-36]|uniref:lytic polysaccharide monooxygenase auxiliary activity family 9 protein n=1 Tax=Streptomyces sp. ISL-36 TaxID=2819182 RepID=UPI001BE5C5EC|nr:lytic polysaccharide monooxygenase [Streptomyces sp. ISL-36]MBT2445261.1 lytic polysaccharide monooxygenase [Streptomyces sp. ISL-36]